MVARNATDSNIRIQLSNGSDRINKWALWSYAETQSQYEQFIFIDVTKPENEVIIDCLPLIVDSKWQFFPFLHSGASSS